jgi:LPS sulfotransferase NodH
MEHAYLVCATQRSGSTLLCELLRETGVAGNPQEFFEARARTGVPPHPGDFLGALPRTGAGIRDDPAPAYAPPYSSLQGIGDYRLHLQRTFRDGTTPNGVFGAKLMFNQLPELRALAGELPEYAGLQDGPLLTALFGAPAYVRVTRRDTARQAVSMWRALQTRRWRQGDGPHGRGAPVPPQYRFAGIDHLVRMFTEHERGWDAFFAALGVAPLRIVYEDDVERDRDRTIAAVLAHIGVSAPPGWHAPEPVARQADAISEQWVAAYHRDRARRGPESDAVPAASI